MGLEVASIAMGYQVVNEIPLAVSGSTTDRTKEQPGFIWSTLTKVPGFNIGMMLA